MEGIKVAITHFFKNKNTITILAILLCLLVIYGAYYYRIKVKTDPISVPYALNEITSKTLITSDMIGTVKVPKSVVTNGVITNVSSIEGMYVKENSTIPKGSMFYSESLSSWEDLPSSLYEDIPEGYTVVYLPVTMETTYGNSIYPGNYIDLYYAVTNDGVDGTSSDNIGKLMIGKLIESIEVLAVVDGNGESVFDKTTDLNSPAYLMFAVDEEYHLLLRKASYLSGDIFPVPRNAEYSKNPSETRISSAYLKNYILSQTVDVADEDLTLMNSTNSQNNTNQGGN